MRIMVSGSRYDRPGITPINRNFILRYLDNIHSKDRITEICQGGYSGVDVICEKWARANGVPVCQIPYPYEKWEWKHGRWAAGRVKGYMPDLILIFPGRSSVAKMTELALEAGVFYLEVDYGSS